MSKESSVWTPPSARPYRPDARYHAFEYQAASSRKLCRIVAKVNWAPDRLHPALGSIVTNLNWASRRVTHFYNQPGTAEHWIRKGKYPLNWTRHSRRGFVENQMHQKSVGPTRRN